MRHQFTLFVAVVLLAFAGFCSAAVCGSSDFAGTIQLLGGCKEAVQQGNKYLSLYTIRYQVSSPCTIQIPIGNNTNQGVNMFVSTTIGQNIAQAQGQPTLYPDSAGAPVVFQFAIDPSVSWAWYLGLPTVGQYNNNHLFVTSADAGASCTI